MKSETDKLELRMYGLVIYNASPIQQAIQYGHACIEYSQKHFKDKDYQQWAKHDKTFIILNGGTTNDNGSGTMQKHLQTLKDNKIKFAFFKEPDLNNALTAIVFLVDERVFNKEKYPDFTSTNSSSSMGGLKSLHFNSATDFTEQQEWTKKIGKQNVFLRQFLSKFRLA